MLELDDGYTLAGDFTHFVAILMATERTELRPRGRDANTFRTGVPCTPRGYRGRLSGTPRSTR
jgi:hypothetical protein